MLTRLATRPEMEVFWQDFLECLHKNAPDMDDGRIYMEIFEIVSLKEEYFSSARLTEKEYEEELNDISELADALSKKTRKFTSFPAFNNPFKFSRFFTEGEFDLFSSKVHHDGYLNMVSREKRFEHITPPMHKMFENLRDYSKEEATRKHSRMELPRRVRAKNAFRTYFVQEVASRFAPIYKGNAPSKIATFCSVALDDPDINSDMVRKA